MPRTYQRKSDTQSRAEQARRKLRAALESEAQPDGSLKPKGFPRFTEFDAAFQETFERLMTWLRRFKKEPLAYSALLQVWLDQTLAVPKGVFADDLLNAARPGRPTRYELGRKALKLYRPGAFGWVRVTKELLGAQYTANATTAVKRVKDAVATYRKRRAMRNDPLDDVRELAFHLLGVIEDLDASGGHEVSPGDL
jgi:hypothetical protein